MHSPQGRDRVSLTAGEHDRHRLLQRRLGHVGPELGISGLCCAIPRGANLGEGELLSCLGPTQILMITAKQSLCAGVMSTMSLADHTKMPEQHDADPFGSVDVLLF